MIIQDAGNRPKEVEQPGKKKRQQSSTNDYTIKKQGKFLKENTEEGEKKKDRERKRTAERI